MDLNRVIGEVAARHGVRLDPDDPALVLVTVTELMLQQAREEFLAATRRATAEFTEAAGRTQEQAGAALAEVLRRSGGISGDEGAGIMLARIEAASARPSRWAIYAVPGGIVLFLAGWLVGRSLTI